MVSQIRLVGRSSEMRQKKHIGKLLKEARLRRRLSAEEVGRRCNVSRSRVYQWEKQRYVFPKNIEPLARALRIPKSKLEAENIKKV
jgi:transcriptional regulator with XRE-family HTH domain